MGSCCIAHAFIAVLDTENQCEENHTAENLSDVRNCTSVHTVKGGVSQGTYADELVGKFRLMLAELKEDRLTFQHIYFDSMNREQREYRLDRELTDTLLTGYSAVARRKVIKRWHTLERKEMRGVVAISATKEFRQFHGIGRLLGLSPNVCAISADLAVLKLAGCQKWTRSCQYRFSDGERQCPWLVFKYPTGCYAKLRFRNAGRCDDRVTLCDPSG
jgi:hypothetical protein